MPPLPIEFHPQAVREAQHARQWYAERGQDIADSFMEELDRAVSLIGEAPQRWATHLHGTRQFLMHRFPYVIVYVLTSDKIEVFAVAHAKQKPGYWADRIQGDAADD